MSAVPSPTSKALDEAQSTKQLGEYLVENKIITDEQLCLAVKERGFTKDERLGEVIVRLGFAKRRQIIDALLVLNPESLIGEQDADGELPLSVLVETNTVVFGTVHGTIHISTLSNSEEVKKILSQHTKKKIKVIPASHSLLQDRLAEMEKKQRMGKTAAADEDAAQLFASFIRDAVAKHASDIHLEVGEKVLYVRQRLDGVLHIVDMMPSSIGSKLAAYIKNRSKLDVAQKREPQDGGFDMDGLDFRVSTLPTGYGEKITIRILDREKALLDIASLGITKIDEWVNLSQLPNGLILVCGSTGSGKTTTLYSTLLHVVDRLHQAVYTIEDPIEYRMPFITQVQVNRNVGLDFGKFLKTVLRHDPDVVIVGEIRDRETMENALTLADTGHLVYATLHTNDVRSTITRLKELGAEDMYLKFLVRGILVQHLARKTCQSCRGDGCVECAGTGYRGRTVVSEFAQIANPSDIEKILAGGLKYHTFMNDAIVKLQSGITNRAELERVLGVSLEIPG